MSRSLRRRSSSEAPRAARRSVVGGGTDPDREVPLPGPGTGEWVWPWWLWRQVDAASPAWLPADLAGRNRTGRNWTVIGLPDSDERWVVDRRGLLAPSSGRWALDWWVGAEDRWRLPSSDPSVRQRLVADAPVIETVVRVPGGEVVSRHWVTPGDGGDVVMVEIENASAAPVAVALALRPVGPDGVTGTRHVAVAGRRLTADGVTVLVADVEPRQSVVSDAIRGDVARTVLANATPAARHAQASCPSGWAGAAMVWPLADRATLRFESPGFQRPRLERPGFEGPGLERQGLRRPGLRRQGLQRPGAGQGRARPGAAETARGWSARVGYMTRLDLPAGPLTSALEAQRRHLLVAAPPAGSSDRRRGDDARVVAALCTAGGRDEVAGRLGSWLDEQHRSGRLGRHGVDTAATLWALGVWARSGADDGLLARSPVSIARAAEHVARTDTAGDPVAATWCVAGLGSAARLLAALGEEAAAARAGDWGRARRAHLLASMPPAAGPATGASAQTDLAVSTPPAAGPATGRTATEAALLASVLGALPAGHAVVCSARAAARRIVAGLPAGAVVAPGPQLGLRPELSLLLATSAALAGEDPGDALRWVLGVASPTWTWPAVVAPRLGTGSHGSGHDAVVAAAMWTCGRALLVADPDPEVVGDPAPGVIDGPAPGVVAGPVPEGPSGAAPSLDVLPAVPVEWLGRPLEVHGLATVAGTLSYAVRWHGERPALLWEITGTGPSPSVTASGLDRAWRGQGRRGEALLGAVPVPRQDAGADRMPERPWIA